MKLRAVALLLATSLFAVIPLRAVVLTWTGAGGAGDTSILSSANWGGSTPADGDILIFPSATYRLVTLSGTTFTPGDMTFDHATNFSFQGASSPTLILGGDLDLQGTNVNFLSSVTVQLSGTRHLAVDATSLLQFRALGGSGALLKEGGGELQLYGAGTYAGGTTVSEGLMTVDGAFSASISHASADLYVGGTSGATLDIKGGATAAVSQVIVGNNASESGSILLHGSGSALSSNGAFSIIGNGGNGSLYLYDGAQLNVNGGTGILRLGHSSGGAGILKIGTDDLGNYFSGGIVNASEITTDAGLSGELKFATTGTAANPYYLTKDGLSNGAAVLISGATEVHQLNGYTVLKSANTYTGDTHVSGGVLIVSDANALGGGSSNVTVDGGTLVANSVNLYNSLTLTSGTLAGNGSFNNAVIGPNFTLSPGLPANGGRIGTLDFPHLELANGGTLEWNLQDPNSTAGTGWDLVTISTPTTLDITATSGGSHFTLKLISLAVNGAPGTATGFNPGQSYSWKIFDSDSTQGFDPAAFDLDLSQFLTDSGSIAAMTLSKTGNILYLNFTPVPEPSTYALLALGLAGSGLAAWRRRRRA